MRRRNRQEGMSLVEIMIGMGLAMTLALGVMSVISYTAKTSKNVTVGADWTSLKSTLYQTITTFTACDPIVVRLGSTYNLTIDIAANNNATNAVVLPELAYPVGATLVTVVKAGESKNGLLISGLKLWALAPPEDLEDLATGLVYHKYLVRLQVEAGRDPLLAGGGTTMTFPPYTLDFKILSGPYAKHNPPGGPEEAGAVLPPNILRGCIPM